MRALDLLLHRGYRIVEADDVDAALVGIVDAEAGLRIQITRLSDAPDVNDVAIPFFELRVAAILKVAVRDHPVRRERVHFGKMRVTDEDQRSVRRFERTARAIFI